MDQLLSKIFLYVVIVISAVFHEYAHGYEAQRLGDDTAKNAGRLTLNPLRHLDPIGTVLIPLFLLFTSGIFIGWAKPVPYNPYNLRDQKYGSLKVGLAGPGANLIIAAILGIFFRFFVYFESPAISPLFSDFLGFIIYINIFLALFNLIPLPPLDGSKIFMDLFPALRYRIQTLGLAGIFLALAMAYFVLPPIAGAVFRLITGTTFGI